MDGYLHQNKACCIQDITEELNKIRSIQMISEDSSNPGSEERVLDIWERSYGSDNSELPSDHFDSLFNEIWNKEPGREESKLKDQLPKDIENTLGVLSNNKIDFESFGLGKSKRLDLLKRFVSSFHFFNDSCSDLKRFEDVIAEKAPELKRALSSDNEGEKITNFVNEVMKTSIPSFDLWRVTFGSDQEFGKVVYNSKQAEMVLFNAAQSIKEDLELMEKNVEAFDNSLNRRIDKIKDLSASMLQEQNFLQRLKSKFKEKDTDYDPDDVREFGFN